MIYPLHIHGEIAHEAENIPEVLLNTLGESIEICLLVVAMMTLIEIFNVSTQGKLFKGLEKYRFGQIPIAAALGLLPGCLGGFAGVSLYSHRIIGFGALIAMLIATTGDESFVMLAKFPGKALMIMGGLFLLGTAVGYIAEYIASTLRKEGKINDIGSDRLLNDKYEIHECDCGHSHEPHHDHDNEHGDKQCDEQRSLDKHQSHEPVNGHASHSHSHHSDESLWHHKIMHFIKEHVWKHVIKRHLPTIFAWTYGVLALFGILSLYIDLDTWINDNTWLMILLATIIGLIPESGPHLIFVSTFAAGILPFPVLLANCIAQDGHACLPLIAENKKSWLIVKGIKTILALAAGYIALLV